ncbi:MAG: hypothetical protein ACM3PD_11435 [Chloroflexota bacterium]|jgi:hypothetical protein
MSSVHFDLNDDRSRAARRRSYISHIFEKTGFTPSRLLARLFMAALAGALAIQFWRDGDR